MPNKIENPLDPISDDASFPRICRTENLYAAWRKVRANRGAGGVDAVSLRDFERNLQDNLTELARNLLDDIYQPLPVKFVQLMKANGKTREEGFFHQARNGHAALASEI